MGLFGDSGLESRVARLEAQVAALTAQLNGTAPTTWEQNDGGHLVAGMPPQVDADISRMAAKGDKIQAIKLARERYGLGLKEAKDYVEGMPDLR